MNQYETTYVYDLILKAQTGDEKALAQLTSENMGLVFRIAARFYGKGVEKEDLHQIGAIGLINAIYKFDTNLGVRFSTYAVPMILGEIKRFFRDNGPIKVSRSIKKTASDIARVSEELQQKTGHAPGVKDIAKALSLPPEEITQALEATAPIQSLSFRIGDDKKATEDFLKDASVSTSFETEKLERLDIEKAIKSLTPREQTIIMMRYGLEKTQADIAKKLGISQVQISRLEKKILLTLKDKLKYTEDTAFFC